MWLCNASAELMSMPSKSLPILLDVLCSIPLNTKPANPPYLAPSFISLAIRPIASSSYEDAIFADIKACTASCAASSPAPAIAHPSFSPAAPVQPCCILFLMASLPKALPVLPPKAPIPIASVSPGPILFKYPAFSTSLGMSSPVSSS